MATLDEYMTASFAGAQKTQQNAAGWYQSAGGAIDNTYNCFAYAVGVTNRRINAQTRAQLENEYSHEKYFPVAITGAPLPDDVELNTEMQIYTRPSEPNQIVHAHRVITATKARSKLGPHELINHNRNTLQAPKPGSPNSYEYGTIRYRYRRDETKYNAMYTTSASGRVRKRTAADNNPDAAKKLKTSTTTSASKTASKPAATPASKPAAKPVAKPVARPAAKPVKK
ncbi:hypothetical protein VMCG_10326 [Cytospora schulzeri]|uniref:DUF7689 domain-containing protein n=1 Tax=Cytospora schulzeri TaxID=448051 RepID=A0A423VCI1_9PEZI|nr:hypothetical protein VMCG_10326 [Valsa malicola]